MDKKPNKNWFNDILPPTQVSLGDGVSYLDRMIAGGDPSQRQFLPSGSKNKFNNKSKPNSVFNKSKSSDKKPLEVKTPSVNLDDESWITDRKKRFPKLKNDLKGNEEIQTINVESLDRAPKSCLLNDSTLPKQDPPKVASNEKTKSINKLKRKMTLFEKLMAMDEQQNE